MWLYSNQEESQAVKNSTPSIVIVGGGHAGAALCSELVNAELGANVHLVCREARLPYQRPPLSKTYLKSDQEDVQVHRGAAWFADAGITVHLGDSAIAIDRSGKVLTLASGKTLTYDWLVLATGTSARWIGALPERLENVAVLRTSDDAGRMRMLLPAVDKVTILGGGFIGLEIAATARMLGKEVVVLDAAERLLSRSVSEALSAHVLDAHRAAGIDVRLGVTVDGFEHDNKRLLSLSVNGASQPVELLVLGIGAVATTELAEGAGVLCNDGILVDAHLRSSDDSILAIGDVARFPLFGSGQLYRLESVQNANDQARIALATIQGRLTAYRSLPWFWSDQGAVRLQMAGLVPTTASTIYRRVGASSSSFSLLHYVDDRLVCAESVNAPADHLAARKLIEAGISPEPEQAVAGAVPLKQFLNR